MKQVFHALIIWAAFMQLATAQTVAMDSTFANDGVALTGIISSILYGRSMAVQPDGKVLVCGRLYSTGTLQIERFNADSTKDASFQF